MEIFFFPPVSGAENTPEQDQQFVFLRILHNRLSWRFCTEFLSCPAGLHLEFYITSFQHMNLFFFVDMTKICLLKAMDS